MMSVALSVAAYFAVAVALARFFAARVEWEDDAGMIALVMLFWPVSAPLIGMHQFGKSSYARHQEMMRQREAAVRHRERELADAEREIERMLRGRA